MKKKITFVAAIIFAASLSTFAVEIVKIGFGPKGAPTTGYNIMGSVSGPNNPIVLNVAQVLKDTTGASSTITITQTTGVAFQQGAPNPATDQTAYTYNVPAISKYFPANICYSWNYNFNASTDFVIAGLSETDEVELNILSSRGANGAVAYTTSRLCSFTATGQGTPVVVSNFQPGGNYSNIATLAAIRPTSDGKITLNIASATGATLMNAMRIKRTPGVYTAIAAPTTNKFTVKYVAGQLVFGTYSGAVALFNTTGKKVAEGAVVSGSFSTNLQKGIYIVKTAHGAAKFCVK